MICRFAEKGDRLIMCKVDGSVCFIYNDFEDCLTFRRQIRLREIRRKMKS